ncbi:MAG TPA: BatD family protein [Pseudomonadales bacterium]
MPQPVYYSIISGMITAIFFACSASVQASELTASVDRNIISSQETLTLMIELSEQALLSEPDFSSLEKDFEILSTSKSSNINFINGKFNGVTQWKMELLPKKSGKLIIPALAFNKLKSKPIEITVTDTPTKTLNNQGHDDIFVETSVDKNSAYIQEQILFTVKLFHQSQQISNWSLSEPDISNAHVLKFDEDKQYYAMVKGIRYGILEKTYVIFPETSGSLILPTIRFSGMVSAGNSPRSRFSFNQGQRVIRDSNPIHLNIKPIPADFKGKYWLPATDVTLHESWSPDKMRLNAGEPITRTITINATAALGSHIPPINATFPASIKQYPDQADISEEIKNNGIIGKRIESTALIPLQKEELKLPPIRIPWWDTDEDKLKFATLPSRKLSIAAASNEINSATNQTLSEPQTSQATEAETPSQSITPKIPPAFNYWKVLALLSLLVNIIMLSALAYVLKIRWQDSKRQTNKNKSSHYKSQPNQLKMAKKQLMKDCIANDAKNARYSLIKWAQLYFQDDSLYSLDTIMLLFNDKELRKRIQQLENSLYGHSNTNRANEWKGEKLAAALKALPELTEKPKKKNEQLPDFYPISS